MKTLRSPLVLPPPSSKTFGRKLARLLATSPQVTPMSPSTAIFLLLALFFTTLFGLHLLFKR